MRFAAAVLIAFSAVAGAIDVRRPPTSADVDSLIAQGLPAARDGLEAALIAGYQPGRMGVSGSSGNPAFMSWLTLWRWCDVLTRSGDDEMARLLRRHLFNDPKSGELTFVGPGCDSELEAIPEAKAAGMAQSPPEEILRQLLPDGERPGRGPLSDVLPHELLAEFMKDDAFSRCFFSTLSEDDYLPLVLANLRDIRAADPKNWKNYRQLAIALAVVNDSKPPGFWPHDQVTQSLVPREQLPVADQFAAWVAANESGGTLLDLRKLSAGQLKFVVDAFVRQDELAWARKNIRLPVAGFDKAFPMVSYRNDRLVKQQYSWDEDPYLLETIRARGGICVDQAYFAMLCGKAKGLPTLFFTGQGADGGHAWFGYMKADDRWELDCARYATQNYSTGHALDPQTWKTISDHDLRLLAASFRDKPEFAASVNDLAMAGIIGRAGNSALAAKAYESAVRTCMMNPAAWDARGDFLVRSGAPPAERKKFHEAALTQFAGNADLKARHQQALAWVARELGDTAAADQLERLILLENKRKRSDLSVGIVARQMQAQLDSGKLDEAGKEFRRQVSSLADTGGGNLFYDVAAPYILALLDAGKKSEAVKSLALIRKKLSPEKDGILDGEIRTLEESASKN
ncbi:MAG: hypothetical protein D4R65_02505 [Verrucomicrobiaceae bacterium]|nr:MAG: hypothetical protein D4R65_02505 [Verrucomicrobiaceae bacterium]